MFLNGESRTIDQKSCTYTPCYCEENIWHLCQRMSREIPHQFQSSCHVVFISNPERVIPLWAQRASKREDGLVLWDYHVILIHVQAQDGSVVVLDLDTTLPFPCSLKEFYTQAIRSEEFIESKYRRFFRVIQGPSFLALFASDRSHMLDDQGQWRSPPPQYPPIKTDSSCNNLDCFINMTSTQEQFGRVLDLRGFCKEFGLQ
ncbi:hypothetical protein TCAL_00481 [Tigriopus californicus]|uniref:Protein N-terminal glutamine amidohydrolase n=1 Tax=Tigriopus californicus TaxID=6832 RepID=A0A553NCJ4_TIGCA|nr:protein N-terminal glutamine amidohydrolase-like [Tigriopus californicus]TRY63172.1 hypothetical protein TCAL_00481 [Tigriopus californicus]|eukprot:TCALIF_00481-PA protein Name:"Similar to WDYHV1 Protein N-terminal glutamine amidohydrolase (Bos taurus)" AED:0.01 eAED:0.01 QI:0/-1/0/1/-1/1/1/0/201